MKTDDEELIVLPALTDEELIALYLAELRRLNRAKSTIKTKTAYLRRLSRDLGIRKATTEGVETWLSRDIEPSTQNLYITTFNSFYKFLMKKRNKTHIIDNPCDPDNLDRPKNSRGQPHPIKHEDLERAIVKANPTMRAWLLLGARQGCRCIEIAGIRTQDIRRENGILHLEFGKGSKPRDVPLHPEVRKALDALELPESGKLWPLMDNEKMSRKINTHLRRWKCLNEEELPATAHSLRHRFGTDINEIADLRTAQELMGHADPGTTAIYTRVNWGKKSQAVSQLGKAIA